MIYTTFPLRFFSIFVVQLPASEEKPSGVIGMTHQ
jgi:hypothetical protein